VNDSTMWTANTVDAGQARAVKVELTRGASVASYAEVIAAWRDDAAFRAWWSGVLASVSYRAFRWETRPVSAATVDDPFECVLFDSPGLARAPEPEAFAAHFAAQPDGVVLAFPNLGGDAIMVVPRPVGAVSAYGHLAAFVRGAPEAQRAALWRVVGEAMARRLGSKPVWLSTAGAGVSWLHVRLDDRPKYYGHAPYRKLADVRA
jgi:hypothetical protein